MHPGKPFLFCSDGFPGRFFIDRCNPLSPSALCVDGDPGFPVSWNCKITAILILKQETDNNNYGCGGFKGVVAFANGTKFFLSSGVNVGFPYNGSDPDIGGFEY